jgi:hypothetical protein
MSSKANGPETGLRVLELAREIYFGGGHRSNSVKTLGSYGDGLTNKDLTELLQLRRSRKKNADYTAGMTADAEKDVLSSRLLPERDDHSRRRRLRQRTERHVRSRSERRFRCYIELGLQKMKQYYFQIHFLGLLKRE